jgi:hypothetical protein
MTLKFPLTAGLLISMALRYDHAFGMNFSFNPDFDFVECQKNTLQYAITVYRGEVTNPRVEEEMYGNGFYSPERESFYLGYAHVDTMIWLTEELTKLTG